MRTWWVLLLLAEPRLRVCAHGSLGYGSMPRNEEAAKEDAEERAADEENSDDQFDCTAGLANFASWNADKKTWCCTNKGLGCSGDAPTTSFSLAFPTAAPAASSTSASPVLTSSTSGTPAAPAAPAASSTSASPVPPEQDGGEEDAEGTTSGDTTTTKTYTSTIASPAVVSDAVQDILKDDDVDIGDPVPAPPLQPGVPTTTYQVYTADPLPPPTFCHENNTMYEPIDMNYTMSGKTETTIEDCQLLCRAIDACGYYTWYNDLKTCHLALPTAQKVTGRIGFKAGPAACDSAQQGADKVTVETGMMKDTCLVESVSYSPLGSRGRTATTAENPVDCQDQCANVSWCEHFVYNSLLKLCDLEDSNSTPMPSTAYQISGPPSCASHLTFDIILRQSEASQSSLQEVLKNKIEVLLFAGIVKEALIVFSGDYIPYDNGVPGNKIPLLVPDEISVVYKKLPANDSDTLVMNIDLSISPHKLLYVAQVANKSNALDMLDHNVETLLSNVGNKFSEKLAKVQVIVEEVTNFKMDSEAGNYAEKQKAAFDDIYVHAMAASSGTQNSSDDEAEVMVKYALEKQAPGSSGAGNVIALAAFVAAAIAALLVAAHVALWRHAQGSKWTNLVDECGTESREPLDSRVLRHPPPLLGVLQGDGAQALIENPIDYDDGNETIDLRMLQAGYGIEMP